jgi:lipoprotein-anchoring transpeptidase ErfK/SrfK
VRLAKPIHSVQSGEHLKFFASREMRRLIVLITAALLASAAQAQAQSFFGQRDFIGSQPDYTGGEPSFFGGGGTSPIPRTRVYYPTKLAPGTIVINTAERRLYLIQPGGTALRYGIGVGRDGFRWSGVRHVSAKREWPGWTPPAQMRRRRPDLPPYMAGGIENPLGARASSWLDSLSHSRLERA